MTKKKITLLAGAVVAVGVLVGGGLFLNARNNDPERILYSALGKDAPKEQYGTEEIKGSTEVSGGSLSYLNTKDAVVKFEGQLTCNGSSEASGETDMELTLRQVNRDLLFKIDKLTSSPMGDPELDAEIEAFFGSLTNKWVLMDGNESFYAGLKDDGVYFDVLGAQSKNVSQKEIATFLQEEKVITILSSKNTKVDGKAAIEYDLKVRRSAYAKFMDRVHSGFGYKDEVLDSLFPENEDEITVVVDKKSKEIVEFKYSPENLCVTFLDMVDSDAAAEAPSRMNVVSTLTDKKTAKDLEKPTEEIISYEDFAALFYEEEATE